MKNSLSLLEDLIALPGPPGQEALVRDYVAAQLDTLGLPHIVDAKGNLWTAPGATIPERPRIVVTAHLDEIALLLTGFTAPNRALVAPLGGVLPYKWGEGPVEILGPDNARHAAVLSFGAIHTAFPGSASQKQRDGQAITWGDGFLITGQSMETLYALGIDAGARVVLGPDRRKLWPLSATHIAGPFFDDRADLVAWLLALDQLRAAPPTDVLFIATVSEEIGGEGAAWALGQTRPEYCIALEVGPVVPDTPVEMTEQPVVWVRDSYATMSVDALTVVRRAAESVGLTPQNAVYSRGGSDASIGQASGLCAHGITLAFAADNTHGFEVMHTRAIDNLTTLLLATLQGL